MAKRWYIILITEPQQRHFDQFLNYLKSDGYTYKYERRKSLPEETQLCVVYSYDILKEIVLYYYENWSDMWKGHFDPSKVKYLIMFNKPNEIAVHKIND